MKVCRLSPEWEAPLKSFLEALEAVGDEVRFHPHEFDSETVKNLAHYKGKDYYCVLVEDERVVGYGLLRGWDKGFARPSLGIAVHPSARGQGLGNDLMEHLHEESRRRGAKQVRLRVKKDNEVAIKLYQDRGYRLQSDQDPSFWEGILDL